METQKGALDKILSAIGKVIDGVSILMFVVIFIVAMAQIIMRWVLRSPLVWSEELTRLLFVWICFLGWTMGTKSGEHIKITAIYNKLNDLGKKLLSTFNMMLVILFSALLFVYGIEMIKRVNSTAVTMPWFSFKMVYLSCPVGNALIILYTAIDIVKIWRPSANAAKTNGGAV